MMDDTVLGRKDLLDLLISRLHEFVVVLADTEGCFGSWHPGVQEHFGYTPEEFIGQSIELLLPLAERLRGAGRRELEAAVEHGRTSDTRWLVTKAGQRMMAEGVTIALRDNGGMLTGFGKVLRDVTERKTAEDNLSALARALDHSTVIVRQLDGTIDHWTTGCERLFGWTAREAIGKRVHDLLKTVFPGERREIQKQLLTSGSWKGEVEHVKRDDTHIIVSTDWVLLTDPKDEPVSVIETHADITARLQIQRELERLNVRLKSMALELERSNQELEEFARIASHDLSAPITSTRWLVDLLSSRHAQGLDESGRKCLQQITQGLERMANLVEAVLAHAQVGQSAIAAADPVHAEDALAVSLDNLRKHIDVSGAVVEYSSLPAVQIVDSALIQLFQNLLSNAIKYRRADIPPVIRISAQWTDPMWVFAVADNGIGIEPEWYERIFHPMQRRHGLEIAGSGIGLATCKKIVTRVGGRIWVESEPGAGSTFFFTLPGPPPDSNQVNAGDANAPSSR